MRRRLLMSAVALLMACGREIGPPEAGVPTDASGGADDGSALDAQVDDAAADAGPIVYDIVDGGGDEPFCHPDGDALQACCNGQFCSGFCIRGEAGVLECSCFGIPGGFGASAGLRPDLSARRRGTCTRRCGSRG